MIASSVFVMLFLAVLNFAASILQGVTSFGEAIVLHIVWHLVASATGSLLHESPLGASDVQIIALVQYSRTAVLNVLMVVFALRSGAVATVSKTLIACASMPTIVATVVGEQLLLELDRELLKFWLAMICMAFAVVYGAIRLYKWRHSHHHHHRGAAAPALPSPPPRHTDDIETTKQTDPAAAAAAAVVVDAPSSATAPTSSSSSPPPPATANAQHHHHILVETTSLKYGVAAFSALSGLTGALTGVAGPPLMIVVLLYDIPGPYVRLLFPLASLPSCYARLFLAVRDNLIKADMVPFHVVAVGAGVAGLFLGDKIGKQVGPRAFSFIVLVLLILAAATMLIENVVVDGLILAACVAAMVYVWWVEHSARLAAHLRTVVTSEDSSSSNEEEEGEELCDISHCNPEPKHDGIECSRGAGCADNGSTDAHTARTPPRSPPPPAAAAADSSELGRQDVAPTVQDVPPTVDDVVEPSNVVRDQQKEASIGDGTSTPQSSLCAVPSR